MQITPISQENMSVQAAATAPKQDARPVQEPVQQQQQAQQKDNVILSQEAKDLAAQLSSRTVLDGLTG